MAGTRAQSGDRYGSGTLHSSIWHCNLVSVATTSHHLRTRKYHFVSAFTYLQQKQQQQQQQQQQKSMRYVLNQEITVRRNKSCETIKLLHSLTNQLHKIKIMRFHKYLVLYYYIILHFTLKLQ